MKKTGKRVLSVLLAVIVLLSATPLLGVDFKASATSRSADEAINWVKGKLGKGLDMDGAYGCQCVDLILAYYDYLGVSRSSGNGADYSWNALPSGWQRIQGAQPQKGDILVYSGNNINPNGHVAIYESDYSTYHQNFNNNKYVENVTEYKYNGINNPYWGVIRPNFASPGPVNIGDNFYGIILNTDCWTPISLNTANNQVTLERETGTANQKWRFERQSDNSYVITSCYNGKALEMTNGTRTAGTQITVQNYNGSNYQKWYMIQNRANSNEYFFVNKYYYSEKWVMDLKGGKTDYGTSVQILEKNDTPAQVWSIYTNNGLEAVNLSASVSSSKVTFTWNKVYGARYDLIIWKNSASGTPYKTISDTSSGCKVDLPAGKYACKVESWDFYQRFSSNTVTVTVNNTTPTQGKVKSVKIDDISLNYKKSTTLQPQITADSGVKYTVKYESSNPKVATVDQNGNVTATKRGSGSATITCTVTDQYGNVVKDTCTVNVTLTFGQKIIIYVLFGWIWY